MTTYENIQETIQFIQQQSDIVPQIALILGSGLGKLAEAVENPTILPYRDLPNFPIPTAQSHAGRLVLGYLADKPIVVMQGRLHYYEGYPMQTIVYPIRVMQQLGAKTLIVTNAAGGLNPDFDVADIMLITDHINFLGDNPLRGENDDRFGPRFSDMSNAYDKELQQTARAAAATCGQSIREGVYVATTGPSFETSAERRCMYQWGASAVGMSTVPEVITAKHMGMQVLGFSAITNVATGAADQPPDDGTEVVDVANVIGKRLGPLIHEVVRTL
ncbi:MAG: purine-nucleoside phosphorylase [Chloroflexota bacterium]